MTGGAGAHAGTLDPVRRRTRAGIRLGVTVIAGMAVSLIAAKPPHSAPGQPAAGRLLISTPQVAGPFFSRSLVLLLDYGEAGAVGLILNRRSTLVIATLLPELADTQLSNGLVQVGGPVSLSTLLLLFRASEDDAPASARRVLADVYLGGGSETFEHLRARHTPADRVRMYLGYSGWAPGQLDQEIARGDWIVIPATPEFVFHARPETLWPELISKHSGVWAAAPDAQRPRAVASRDGPTLAAVPGGRAGS